MSDFYNVLFNLRQEDRKDGRFVTIDGRHVFLGGPGSGGGGTGGGSSNTVQQFPTTHSVQLPSKVGKITIDQAAAALNEMGYELGQPKIGPPNWSPTYPVLSPEGTVTDMPVKDLQEFIYSRKT